MARQVWGKWGKLSHSRSLYAGLSRPCPLQERVSHSVFQRLGAAHHFFFFLSWSILKFSFLRKVCFGPKAGQQSQCPPLGLAGAESRAGGGRCPWGTDLFWMVAH